MKIYFLNTSRLGFSHWQENDIEYAYSLRGDKNVSRYLTATQVFEKKDIEARVKLEMENEKLYKVQYWPVFELEKNKFAGCCGLPLHNP